MSRVRVIGLVALGVLAVLLFLVAPDEGRFSQTPTLVLVGVIALLWHLAWTDALDASADDVGGAPTAASAAGVDGAAAQRSTRPVPTPPEASHVAAAVSTRDDEEDLSLLPDPPADWPPPGVEVPMVFRAETVEVEFIDLTVRTTGPEPLDADRIDLTADDPDRIDLTPGVVAPPAGPPTAEPGRSADDEPDPWLAFAAAMFRDD
jgi:hypothetical protein